MCIAIVLIFNFVIMMLEAQYDGLKTYERNDIRGERPPLLTNTVEMLFGILCCVYSFGTFVHAFETIALNVVSYIIEGEFQTYRGIRWITYSFSFSYVFRSRRCARCVSL